MIRKLRVEEYNQIIESIENTKRENKLAYHREYNINNKVRMTELRRRAKLKAKYGMSVEEYQELFNAQQGVCAICDKFSDKALVVDHCHITGIIRGLLCVKCNTALGMFEDNLELLHSAVAYMEEDEHDS